MYFGTSYSVDSAVSTNEAAGLDYLVKSERYSAGIETRVVEYRGQSGKTTEYSKNGYYQESAPVTYYLPAMFLKGDRPETSFINATEQVEDLIKETFLRMTGKSFPQNVSVNVCSEEGLKQKHSAFCSWLRGIQGFAINGKGLKEVFVKNNPLDELMMVVGHELGHVYTNSLANKHDEEAKAFSFAAEWARTIKRHDIGSLSDNIKDSLSFSPAKNGLHDAAFLFVNSLMGKGLTPMRIHWDLVKGYRSLFGFYD